LDIKRKLNELIDDSNSLYKEDPEGWTSSRLYLFFAGHGMADGFRDCDLLLADAGPGYYEQRAPCEYILDHLIRIRPAFKEIVFFADCCRNMKSGRAAFILEDKAWPSRGDIHHASFYATIFGKESYEPKDAGRGFFSQALLEGLKGRAAPTGSPITTANLHTFVKDRVEQLTAKAPSGPQVPDVHFPRPIELLAQSPGSSLTPGTATGGLVIRFRRFTGNVQLHGPDDQPVAGVAPFAAIPGSLWRLPALPQVIHHVVAITGNQSLLDAKGMFSWKEVPQDNDDANPMEM
jgi:hypothetical protein